MCSNGDNSIHERFLRQAIQLSISAVEHGNHPFGACLVSSDGEVLLAVENTVGTSNNDVTRHAELSLISLATQKFSQSILKQCTLYSSCEPCVMCAGALCWSGIRRLVYALSEDTLAKYAGSDHLRPCRSVLSPSLFMVIGPMLENEAVEIHRTFWSRFSKAT